jgi:hypothetical protein
VHLTAKRVVTVSNRRSPGVIDYSALYSPGETLRILTVLILQFYAYS